MYVIHVGWSPSSSLGKRHTSSHVMQRLIKSPKRILDKYSQRPLYKHFFLELFAVGYEDFCGKTVVGLQHEQKYKHAKIKSFPPPPKIK